MLDSSGLAVPGAELTETHFAAGRKGSGDEIRCAIFETLVSRIEGGAKSLRFQSYIVDSLNLALASSEANVSLERLTLAKAANTASLQATYSLPADLKSWEAQPLNFDLAVDAPELSAFVAPESTASLNGALKIMVKGSAQDRTYNGDFAIAGRNIEVQGVPIRTIDAHLQVAGNQAQFSQLEVIFDDKNSIRGGGNMQLAEPFSYGALLTSSLETCRSFNRCWITKQSRLNSVVRSAYVERQGRFPRAGAYGQCSCRTHRRAIW